MDFQETLNRELFERIYILSKRLLEVDILEAVIYVLLYFLRGASGPEIVKLINNEYEHLYS